MRTMLLTMAAACGTLAAGSALSEITFYEREEFRGRSFTVGEPVDNFARFGFNDRASSAVVRRGRYLVCDDAGFRGRCVTLAPGDYRSLGAMGLNNRVSSARPVGRGPEAARAILYGQPNFGGGRLVLEGHNAVRDFSSTGFNDKASSLRVEGGQWLLCSRADFRGDCRSFGPGEYHHLPHELNNRVSSARLIEGSDRREGLPPRREGGRD